MKASLSEIKCYQVLGLSPGASLKQVKKAFRRRALALHPDLNPDNPLAEEDFKRVSLAYVLIVSGGPFAEPPQEDQSAVSERGVSIGHLAQMFCFFIIQPEHDWLLGQLEADFARLGLRFDRPFLATLFAPDRTFTGRVRLHRPLASPQPHWPLKAQQPSLWAALSERAASWTETLVPERL